MYERELDSFKKLLETMDTLREKCPWDREQTFQSLRNNTIEETFELTQAITDNDKDGIKEELGDLLLHIVFYSKLGSEEGAFNIADVCDYLCDKLVYRHPHVYGDIHADNPEEVIHNWELLKLKEKNKQADKERNGVLSGVPRSLPAMVKAFRIGQKAASAGFDWQKKEDVWDKVKEEVGEVEQEITNADKQKTESEIGDLFFALVNMSRLYGIDPENALEKTNKKFMSRFSHIEKCAADDGKTLGQLSLDEMETYWQDAKKNEK